MINTEKHQLRDLVENLCLKQGSFTLSTGVQSNFYFDCKGAMLDGEALSGIADAFLEDIKGFDSNPTAIGGLTMGADFIVAAVIQRSYQLGLGVNKGSIVRKESKVHGTMNRVENKLDHGTKIVVVDDVITSGASTAKACDEFIKGGYEIVGIMALVDREAGGAERLSKKYGVEVKSVFVLSDFKKLAQAEQDHHDSENIALTA